MDPNFVKTLPLQLESAQVIVPVTCKYEPYAASFKILTAHLHDWATDMTHNVVSVHLNEFCQATLFQQYPPHQTHPKTLRSKAVKTTVEICFPSGFSFSHKSAFSSWSSFSSGSMFSGGSSVFRLRVRGVRFPY